MTEMATARERHPHAFIARDEDPRKRKRKMPMEVLSLGYSRTGTMTMKTALEILGIPTWHWVEMGANPPDMDMWTDALLAKYEGGRPFGRTEFDLLLSDWGGVTDQPACLLGEELQKAYPEAKVVLVERDVERWFKSFCDTVLHSSSNSWIPLGSVLDPVFMRRVCRQTDITMKYFWNVSEPRTIGLSKSPKAFEQWRANARSTYQKHNEMVRRVTPKEKLLIFKLEDGWEPLCKFLEKLVPDVPFPRVNETESVNELARTYIQQSYKRAFYKAAKRVLPFLVGCIAVVAWCINGGRSSSISRRAGEALSYTFGR